MNDVNDATIEHLTAERDSLKEAFDNFLNDIWQIADDGLGEWEYPGQITRNVKAQQAELARLCTVLATAHAAAEAYNWTACRDALREADHAAP